MANNTKKRRGRPVGSKNKVHLSTKKNVAVLNFDKDIKNSPITKKNQLYDIIQYGSDNCYPYKILDLFNTSITMRSCVEFATNAIIGDGIDFNKVNIEDAPNPNYFTGWNQFLQQLAFDFVMYDAFSFQIVKNKDGKTYSFFHQPIETVRLEEMDEDGISNFAYLCRDWSAPSKYPPVKVPLFGFQDEKEIPMGEVYLFYHRRYNPINAYYGIPSYTSGLNCIASEAAYQQYDLRAISNGFVATGAITLPGVETDEERNQIITNITNMFTGEDQANSLLIQFRNNDEDRGIEYVPFAAPNSHVDLYESANERTTNRIMAAFKIPTKALIGYPADTTGFSDSGAYLEAAFKLYEINVARQNRNEILDVINQLFAMNGVDVEIVLKPLNYNFDLDEETPTNDDVSEEEKTTQDGVTDDTATERENNT